MKLAICTGISQFDQDRLRDRDWSRKFLGSAWVTSLYEQQTKLGIEVASGDVALNRVKSGQWRAETIHVVQEMDAQHGQKLCQMGSIPSVLTMLESPLVSMCVRPKRLRPHSKMVKGRSKLILIYAWVVGHARPFAHRVRCVTTTPVLLTKVNK